MMIDWSMTYCTCYCGCMNLFILVTLSTVWRIYIRLVIALRSCWRLTLARLATVFDIKRFWKSMRCWIWNQCEYNWIVSYFEDRGHVTKFKGLVSGVKRINSSVVQGSGIGPASYSIAESDLHPKRKETFAMHKFADDVDLVTGLENYNEIQDEIDHIESWAANNNLVLNKAKTKEIIFCKGRSAILPPTTEGRERVTSFKKLGVTLQSTLSMKDHTDSLISACSNKLYALNTLRSQGLCIEGLQQVFKSKILSKLLYALPAWIGLAGKEDRREDRCFPETFQGTWLLRRKWNNCQWIVWDGRRAIV